MVENTDVSMSMTLGMSILEGDWEYLLTKNRSVLVETLDNIERLGSALTFTSSAGHVRTSQVGHLDFSRRQVHGFSEGVRAGTTYEEMSSILLDPPRSSSVDHAQISVKTVWIQFARDRASIELSHPAKPR